MGHRRLCAGRRAAGERLAQLPALASLFHRLSQLCGRRTFYQLLVCDNQADTDIGAPYYSDQQLFPGFMMTEYDGKAHLLVEMLSLPLHLHTHHAVVANRFFLLS